ncbi:hypothetical protein D3C78_1176760 [compost metagenome]
MLHNYGKAIQEYVLQFDDKQVLHLLLLALITVVNRMLHMHQQKNLSNVLFQQALENPIQVHDLQGAARESNALFFLHHLSILDYEYDDKLMLARKLPKRYHVTMKILARSLDHLKILQPHQY